MKKNYLLIAVCMAACAGSLSLQAQTDVTSTYLTNAGFDNSCNYLVGDVAANLVVANAGANLKVVSGWTVGTIGDNSAAAAFEFGYTGTLNGVAGPIPLAGADAATGTGHGALGISAAWAATITYTQNVTLPVGKYTIEYAAYNSGPNVADNSRVGWVPNSGTSVVSAKTSFAQNAWVTESLTFTVVNETAGKIQVGITAPNSGSAAVGRIFFDYVKIFVHAVDKTELLNLKDSAAVMYSAQQAVGTSTVYADLNAAIAASQVIYDNSSATASQVILQESALKQAIANVYSAIVIYSRVSTWTTLPYTITSVITNPSFETNSTVGWTNVGGFGPQNNTSFAFKEGTYYVEKWKSSGNWTGLKLSQKIVDLPNGVYKLTAGALNNPNTTGGAFLFANDQKVEVIATNDYSVTVTVTNNLLEIGYEVTNGGNYVAVDNFRLTYVSDGSPYIILAPENLFFDPSNLTKTFVVSGGNVTSDVVLAPPAGIVLDKTTLTAAEVNAGVTVTATFDNATVITNGIISATTGSVVMNLTVTTSADLSCFTPLHATLTNLIPNPYLNDISAFGGWGKKSVVFGEAYCGAACVKFNATTNTWPDGAALDVSSVAWEANSTYELHAWVKAVDGTFAFYAKGTDPDVTIPVPMTGDVWTEISTTFTTGAAPTANFFTFNNVDGASTGKIAYIDNYELYNITSILTKVNNVVNDQNLNIYKQGNQIVADFNLSQSSTVEFSVYSAQGTLISKEKAAFAAGKNQKVISSTLASGVYLVNMISEGKTITRKVIK